MAGNSQHLLYTSIETIKGIVILANTSEENTPFLSPYLLAICIYGSNISSEMAVLGVPRDTQLHR